MPRGMVSMQQDLVVSSRKPSKQFRPSMVFVRNVDLCII